MMATYFHGGSEIQQGTENLQTLYLMNPNYVTSYTSEAPNNNPNMVLFNPSVSGHHHHHHHPQFIGIPLAGGPHSEIQNHPCRTSSPLPAHHHPMVPPGGGSLHGVAVSRAHYSPTNQFPSAVPSVDGDGGGFRRSHTGPLSLSLSPHNNSNTVGSSVVSNGGGVQGGMVGSKYLRAAKELLDEVVNVGSYCNGESSRPHKEKEKGKRSATANTEAVTGDEGEEKVGEQLTTAQRQELQMKKAKLLNMLDEVEQRYRQYHTEMQVVVSSFEQSAGIGSAKSYTSLALQTISKQFRCLKDVIVSQIKATSKSLGEVDHDSNVGGSSKLEGGGVGSRIKFVDHQLRQQRALQQLGMMQHNAWRPQRGLPERAVSVLRAWLFEHFLHPYPKDSDKHILAKQTGLTRSQVSNWFINARVRLWKPMVEEMYLEEIKTQEQTGGDSETQTNAMTDVGGATTGNEPNKDHSTPKAKIGPKQQNDQVMVVSDLMQPHQVTNDMISNLSTTSMSSPRFTLIGSSSDMETLMARSPKKQRSMQGSPSSILSMDMEMKPPDHHNHNHNQSQSPMIIAGNHNHNHNHNHDQHQHQNQGFMNNPYFVNNDMMGRFNPDHLITAHPYHGNNNGVSLTLGLPHRENQQHNFIPNQGMQLGRRQLDNEDPSEFCGISMGMGQPSNAYHETIDAIQTRKSFAAHQLLHDFVQ